MVDLLFRAPECHTVTTSTYFILTPFDISLLPSPGCRSLGWVFSRLFLLSKKKGKKKKKYVLYITCSYIPKAKKGGCFQNYFGRLSANSCQNHARGDRSWTADRDDLHRIGHLASA